MTTLNFFNAEPNAFDSALAVVAARAPDGLIYPRGVGLPRPETTTASYGPLLVRGVGFVYDPIGRLYDGTITSISLTYPQTGGSNFQPGSTASATGVSFLVSYLLNAVATYGSIVPALFGTDNTITVNTGDTYSVSGDNLFNIAGPGVYAYQYPFQGTMPVDHTFLSVYGTAGADTANFAPDLSSNDLRGDAAISGGGGNEMVYLHGPGAAHADVLKASLQLVDTLQFLDGSLYEDDAAPGAQAALMFEGIFGRLPDAINAGGFALVATQNGTDAAAAQMLATPEASAATAGLGNADFVTRLYQNMLHRAPEAPGLAGWQADLDGGALSQANVAARFASGIEAQQVNFAAFATGSVFAADPNAVEVLRGFELLLNRIPEAISLATYTRQLDAGTTASQFYGAVQSSAEFASLGPNHFGITTATPVATVIALAHADPFNGLVGSLVTSQGVAHFS